jgi:hypothetical protein
MIKWLTELAYEVPPPFIKSRWMWDELRPYAARFNYSVAAANAVGETQQAATCTALIDLLTAMSTVTWAGPSEWRSRTSRSVLRGAGVAGIPSATQATWFGTSPGRLWNFEKLLLAEENCPVEDAWRDAHADG